MPWRRTTKANSLSIHPGDRSPFSSETTRRLSAGWRVKPIAGGRKIPLGIRWTARRGRGVGRELMDRAEIRAREGGCHSAWLDTFSFQARGFYEKLGYEANHRFLSSERWGSSPRQP